MEILKTLSGAAFLLFGTFIVFMSYVRQISNFRNRHNDNARWSSPAPFIGPLFVIVGYFLLATEFSYWILLTLVLDPDTVITILGIPYLIKGLQE